MAERFRDLDSGMAEEIPARESAIRLSGKKSHLFAIRNLYFADFAMFRRNSNSRFAIRNLGGEGGRRFGPRAASPAQKRAILSRLEVERSLCFVNVAGNSNRGVSIRRR